MKTKYKLSIIILELEILLIYWNNEKTKVMEKYQKFVKDSL